MNPLNYKTQYKEYLIFDKKQYEIIDLKNLKKE